MRARFLHILALLLILGVGDPANAERADPFDPFDVLTQEDDPGADAAKSAAELTAEGTVLLSERRHLDARTKLLRALERDSRYYRAHILLSSYYSTVVGHYRLALRYAKRAEQLFFEEWGRAPYRGGEQRSEHAQILYLLANIRLDLDNYQGALELLDEFSSYGYVGEWYPATRAWILMKLGRLDDATAMARAGVASGFELGRSLNMLGILLSMQGARSQSLRVFQQAINYEMALGSSGQPATPLNNSGEVYKEMFNDDDAERSWVRATSLPDGCEHVLPSLNLALLQIEQVRYESAAKTIDDFMGCYAQFTLRNDEEHRALVHLARGRLALLSGHLDSALQHLERAAEARQWLGKIGTNIEDLRVGVMMSLAQALDAQRQRLRFMRPVSLSHRLSLMKQRTTSALRSWWLFRRTRQVLMEDLVSLEDLYIRNTDSLIEYSTFGEVLAGIPTHTLQKRVVVEERSDDRHQAERYYRAYLAENLLRHGEESAALELIREVEPSLRRPFDDALRLHLETLRLRTLDEQSDAYQRGVLKLFGISPAAVRNSGLRLPVRVESGDELADLIDGSAFIAAVAGISAPTIQIAKEQGRFAITLRSDQRTVKGLGESPEEALNNLMDLTFQQAIVPSVSGVTTQ